MTKKSSSKDRKVDQSALSAPRCDVKDDFKQTSPITIGGGSVSIDFHHGDYQKNGSTFVRANDEIETVWVYDSGHSLKWDLLKVVLGKDCVLTIHTMVGGSTRDILIKSKPRRGLLSVEFDEGQFPLTSDRRHFNPNRKIVGVIEFKDNSDGSTATFSVPSGGDCSIVIVNKF